MTPAGKRDYTKKHPKGQAIVSQTQLKDKELEERIKDSWKTIEVQPKL